MSYDDDDDDVESDCDVLYRATASRRTLSAAGETSKPSPPKRVRDSDGGRHANESLLMSPELVRSRRERWREMLGQVAVTRVRAFGTCSCARSTSARDVCARWGGLRAHPVLATVTHDDDSEAWRREVLTCVGCYEFLTNGEWLRGEDGTFEQCVLCGHGDDSTIAFVCEKSGCGKVVCEPCVIATDGEERALFLKKNEDALFLCYECDLTRFRARLKEINEQTRVGVVTCVGIRSVRGVGNANMNQYLIQRAECAESGVARTTMRWIDDDPDFMDMECAKAIRNYVLMRTTWSERGGPVKTHQIIIPSVGFPSLTVTEFVHCFPMQSGELCNFGLSVYENVFSEGEITEFERNVFDLAVRARNGDFGGNPFIVQSPTAGRTKIFFGYAYEKGGASNAGKQRLVRGVPSVEDPRAAAMMRMSDALILRGVLPSGFSVDQIVVNVYDNARSYLLAHKDACHLFDKGIYSVRLFNPRIVDFAPDGYMRMNTDRGVVRVLQSRGSVTAMTGFAKESVQHCVPPMTHIPDCEYFSASVMFRMANRKAIKRAVEPPKAAIPAPRVMELPSSSKAAYPAPSNEEFAELRDVEVPAASVETAVIERAVEPPKAAIPAPRVMEFPSSSKAAYPTPSNEEFAELRDVEFPAASVETTVVEATPVE